MDIPRLIGPALLTLVFYLWDAFHAAAPARRRDRAGSVADARSSRSLGVVVVAWNLLLRS